MNSSSDVWLTLSQSFGSGSKESRLASEDPQSGIASAGTKNSGFSSASCLAGAVTSSISSLGGNCGGTTCGALVASVLASFSTGATVGDDGSSASFAAALSL